MGIFQGGEVQCRELVNIVIATRRYDGAQGCDDIYMCVWAIPRLYTCIMNRLSSLHSQDVSNKKELKHCDML